MQNGRVTTSPHVTPTDVNAFAGNHVIIDHGNGEFSTLGHLHRGRVSVELGQVVVRTSCPTRACQLRSCATGCAEGNWSGGRARRKHRVEAAPSDSVPRVLQPAAASSARIKRPLARQQGCRQFTRRRFVEQRP